MYLQESGQMYLETIYILSKKMADVRSLDIAEYMGFSKPSVSRAVKLLKNDEYIFIDGKGHITLSEKGEKIASNIYEKHQIISKFLMKLGVNEDIAIADACKIEHDISDESFEALKKHISNEL